VTGHFYCESILVEETTTTNDDSMLVVRAENTKTKRTASLFKIVYVVGQPYPASIFPRDDKELPNFLKKRYYKEPQLPATQQALISMGMQSTEGKWIEQEWVCEAPQEFREKLSEVCNLGITKREIIGLLTQPEESVPGNSSTDNSDEPATKGRATKKTKAKPKAS